MPRANHRAGDPVGDKEITQRNNRDADFSRPVDRFQKIWRYRKAEPKRPADGQSR